jgi:hypothetical protein
LTKWRALQRSIGKKERTQMPRVIQVNENGQESGLCGG